MKMMKKRKAVKDLMAVAECLRDPIGIYKILKRAQDLFRQIILSK
jgi:hypothetical protein